MADSLRDGITRWFAAAGKSASACPRRFDSAVVNQPKNAAASAERLLDLAGLDGVAFEPVEPVGAEQDEMDDQRQNEQEREESDQRPARIEEQPNFLHVSPLSR